ncbi:MAG: hypothetical protein RL220_794 [Bacteroidota bacterium]|jgi:hypothetical protein
MFRLFTISIILLFCASVKGQAPSCKDVKNGKFEITAPESGTTYITRSGDEQRERNKKLGYDVIFSVVWTDECTYELRPKKLIKGDPLIMGDGTHVVYNSITDISAEQYTVIVSTNFFEGAVEFVVERN